MLTLAYQKLTLWLIVAAQPLEMYLINFSKEIHTILQTEWPQIGEKIFNMTKINYETFI